MKELVFENKDQVRVYLDDRELRSECARKLFELGADLKPVRLPVADYILSARAAVERKNAPDFESSIIDGRLFAQAKDLKETFESPVVAVVGKAFARVNPKALLGAFISLAVDFKLPVLFFDDEAALAEFVFALGRREQLLPPREAKLQFNKKGFTLAEQQQLIVESLPLIGPKNAKNLLNHFGSVKDVVNALETEPQDVEGIGKERAKGIRKVLDERFKED
ncbi:MAG: ERCC4 domain-containing protein [Candidatus Micrarchaeota archaeon]